MKVRSAKVICWGSRMYCLFGVYSNLQSQCSWYSRLTMLSLIAKDSGL